MNKIIILSVTNDLSTDIRLKKICYSLCENGFTPILVGRLLPDSTSLKRPYQTKRFKLLFNKGPLFYANYNIRLFLFLLTAKYDLLVANDLDTLAANFFASMIKKKPLVYDTHEIFPEVPELTNRPKIKRIWSMIEKLIFPKLKYVYTVNNSVASYYSAKYKINVNVVRNIAPQINQQVLSSDRAGLDLPVNKKILIMQGAHINIDRGGEEAVLAMKYLSDVLLLIIGSGDVFNKLEQLTTEKKLKDKIRFIPRLPYEQLMQYTACADIGLSLDKDSNLNYRFSLPNKVFDYIQAQVPLLVSDLPELRLLVNENEIGCITDSHNPEHIAQNIQSMLKDERQYKMYKDNLKNISGKLCWEKEEEKLLEIYKNILVSDKKSLKY